MTLTHSRPWTPREDDLLRRDWKKRPTLEIALLLDRSVNGVQARAMRLGLSVKRHHMADHEADFRRLHALGYSDREIADLLGLPRKITWRWRRQLGLPPACPQHAGLPRQQAQAAQRREQRAKVLGWPSWSEYACSRKRLKAQYTFAGCTSQAEALICTLLREAQPDGLTSADIQSRSGDRWACADVPAHHMRRLYDRGALRRHREAPASRHWTYTLAGPGESRSTANEPHIRVCRVGT